MHLLLIEDDEIKGAEIVDFLKTSVGASSVAWEKSFSGGLKALVGAVRYDALILDMSLPDHDTGYSDSSGAEPFAGRDLLKQMKFRKVVVPTIVVTMFDQFGKGDSKVSVEELRSSLAQQFPSHFRGLVYYSLAQEGWRSSLKKLIDSIGRGN